MYTAPQALCIHASKSIVYACIHTYQSIVYLCIHTPERWASVNVYTYSRALCLHVYALPRVCISTHTPEHCVCLCVYTHTFQNTVYACVYIHTRSLRSTCAYARTPEHCICTCTHSRLLFKLVYIHQSIVYSYVSTPVRVHTHTHFKNGHFCPHSCEKLFGNHLPTTLFFKKRRAEV